MADAGDELNQIATEVEHRLLALPRSVAAVVAGVVAARLVGDAPLRDRTAVDEGFLRAYRETLTEYGDRDALLPVDESTRGVLTHKDREALDRHYRAIAGIMLSRGLFGSASTSWRVDQDGAVYRFSVRGYMKRAHGSAAEGGANG